MNVAIYIPIIIALIGAAIGYIKLVRIASGRIDRTEAIDLWKESAAIREDYRRQLEARDRRVERCEERLRELEKVNDALAAENWHLKVAK